ncbi:hypothetical protein BH11PLA1_BH11PLA1_05400 [soil metagenome]
MAKLTGDITAERWLAAKGLLFVIAAAGAAGAVVMLAVAGEGWWWVLGVHLVGVWCGCRAYYFAFYVIERYAGGGPYAGVVGAARAGLRMMVSGRV